MTIEALIKELGLGHRYTVAEVDGTTTLMKVQDCGAWAAVCEASDTEACKRIIYNRWAYRMSQGFDGWHGVLTKDGKIIVGVASSSSRIILCRLMQALGGDTHHLIPTPTLGQMVHDEIKRLNTPPVDLFTITKHGHSWTIRRAGKMVRIGSGCNSHWNGVMTDVINNLGGEWAIGIGGGPVRRKAGMWRIMNAATLVYGADGYPDVSKAIDAINGALK